MRLARYALLGTALVLVPPAEAAPLGAPEVVRLATAGDAGPRPQARSEWWQVVAVDPRTRHAIRVRVARGFRMEGVDVDVSAPSWHQRLPQALDPRGRRVRATGTGGTTTLRRVGGRWRLTMTGPRMSGRLTLTRARRGPTGLRWRLGDQLRWPPRWEPVDMSWSALVATSLVSGSLTVDGTPVRLDGWRASLEHVWGGFDVDDSAWEYGNAFIVHRRRGGAALVFGVNRIDTVTGAGARDAQWLGVLAEVGRRGTRVCRPAVHRRRWVPTGTTGPVPFASELRARCGRRRIVFRRRDRPFLWSQDGIAHYEYARSGTASGGGTGVAVAFGHQSLR